MDNTNAYYQENADLFFSDTVDADISPLRERFLKHVPKGGRILDFGCGSGRDAKCFSEQGYVVSAIDGSEELCKRAREYTGIDVKCMDFFALDEKDTYDGIWACASVLHVEKERLPELLGILSAALKEDGVIYLSFKYGDFEGQRDGRFFTDLDEASFREVLQEVPGLRIVDEWKSLDVRRGRNVTWINGLLKRV